jgi:hypothetical protein
MLLEWILFAILGYCVFSFWPAPQPQSRWLLAIVFVVLMVLWLVGGVYGGAIMPPYFHR